MFGEILNEHKLVAVIFRTNGVPFTVYTEKDGKIYSFDYGYTLWDELSWTLSEVGVKTLFCESPSMPYWVDGDREVVNGKVRLAKLPRNFNTLEKIFNGKIG